MAPEHQDRPGSATDRNGDAVAPDVDAPAAADAPAGGGGGAGGDTVAGSDGGAGGDPGGPDEPRWRRRRRKVARGLRWLVVGVLLAVVAIFLLVWLVFPWTWATRQATAEMADRFGVAATVDEVDVDLFKGLELRGLCLDPPAGFAVAPLCVERISAEYGPGDLIEGNVDLKHLVVERPVVRLEERDGRWNVEALIASFTGAPDEAAAPSPEAPAADSGPSTFRLNVGVVEIREAEVHLTRPGTRLQLSGLTVRGNGRYGPEGSRFAGTVKLLPIVDGQDNLVVVQGDDPAATTGLFGRVAVSAHGTFEDLARLTASVLLEGFRLTARAPEQAPVEVEDLTLLADAAADLDTGHAELQRLRLAVDGEEWIVAEGRTAQVLDDPAFTARVARLALDLDRLAPLVRPFLPGLAATGTLEVRDLGAQARVSELASGQWPEASGTIRLDGLGVRLPAADLDLAGLNGELEVSSRPGAEDAAARLAGRLRLGRVRTAGFTVQRLTLGLEGTGTSGGQADVSLDLGVGRVRSDLPALAGLDLGLTLRTSLAGDLTAGDLTVRRLDLQVPELLGLKLTGQVRQMGERVRAQLTLPPVELGRVLRRLPAPVRKSLPPLKLGGRLGLELRVTGGVPARLRQAAKLDPLAWPLHLDGALKLTGVRATLTAPALTVNGGTGELALAGTPRSQEVSGALAFGLVDLPDAGVRAEKIALDLAAQVGGLGSRVTGRVGLEVGAVAEQGRRAKVRGLTATAEGSLEGEAIAGQLALAIETARAAALGITVSGLDLTGDVTRAPDGPWTGSARLALGAVREANVPANATDTTLELQGQYGDDGHASGEFTLTVGRVATPVAAVVTQDLRVTGAGTYSPAGVEAQVKLRAGSLIAAPLGEAALRAPGLELDVAAPLDFATVELRDLALRLPDRGLQLKLRGDAGQFDAPLPEADLSLELAVVAPRWITVFHPASVRGEGTVALTLRSAGDGVVDLSGDLGFRGLDVSAGGGIKALGLNGAIPLRQRLRVHPTVTLITGSEDVLQRKPRDIIYEQLRPYRGERASLRLKRLDVGEHNFTDAELDLRLEQGTVALDRIQVTALGGTLVGDLALQLADNGTNLRTHAALQLTSVDIGGLVGTSFTGSQSQISGGLELKLGLASRLLEADINLTKIGSKMLDRALLYLDPDGRNAGISDIRQQLNDYAISPRLVSARIKHGNLRLDIKMKKEGIGLGRIAADNIEKISRNSLRRFPLGILMDRIFPALDTLLGRPAAQAP